MQARWPLGCVAGVCCPAWVPARAPCALPGLHLLPCAIFGLRSTARRVEV